MKKLYFIVGTVALVAMSCASSKKITMANNFPSFDLEGHRGARGLMPENTIPAMIRGVDVGMTTAEMDVVISGDNQVVVSHDPYFSEVITTTPDGKHLSKKEAGELLLYKMSYDSIRKYDVGLKPNPGFPQQQKMAVSKPLLSALLDSVEEYTRSKNKTIWYNIEIKSREGFDGVRHPDPKSFSELLIAVLKEKNVLDRTVIQSFDVRPLQYIHQTYPSIKLSYLVEKTTSSLEEQFSKLGFQPTVYSPHYTMVTKEMVSQCKAKGIKVIPWTVNTVQEMNELITMGVDGIISDYPDLFSQLTIKK